MNRRQSLDKTGILSPPGSFIAPSPSPSIPASPRLQPSPSQSPFGQDVLLVTNNTVVTQESDHKTTIPTRRPSFHQVANSPNAGTVLFRPSPTQSPAGASTFITNTGTELNTTLVGSNNIALNKKIGKKTAQPHGGHGHGMSATASSPKASKKAMSLTNSPITSPSPIASPTLNTTLRPPTPQPIIQQIPVMSSGNQLLQIIQGPQIIAPQRQTHIISSAQAIAPQHTQQPGQFVGHQQQQIKNNKAPQQILPKPTTTVLQVTPGGKNTTTVAKGTLQIGHHQPNPSQQQQTQLQTQIVQSQAPQVVQQAQQSAPPHQVISAAAQTTATANATQGNIILPTGGLNTQPLLVNQMPVIVQQNTPQGVQFILRPSAPQITAPGLVIHNTRPQLPPPQPQQLLRIVNANGSMQLAAATPTFIVSSQANLIQQNLQGIKTNTGTPLTQLGGLQAQRQPQQIAAAINQHLIGQSVAQIQNLQLNGNLTHIQMPNGLNGQFISQLPSQFQQSLTGFNQLNQNISLNQISSTNLSQIAAAAAASQNMAAFQSPPPPQQSHGGDLVVSAQMQFTAQHQNTITVSQAQQLAQQQIPPIPISPIMSPQHPTILQSVTPEPVRNPPTPVKHTAHGKMQQVEKIDSKSEGSSGGGKHDSASGKATSVSTSKPKKAKKSKKKQSSSNSDTGGAIMSTGKLDLANVMKLCGIMDDDDLMDGEMDMPMTTADPQMEIKETSPQMQQEQNVASTAGDIMITIPFSGQNTDIPFSFTIPNSVENSDTMQQQQQQKVTTAVAKVTPELKNDPVVQTVQTNSTAGSGAPFMITIDSTEGTLGQPYTISIPHIPSSDSGEKSGVIVSGQSMATDAGGSVGITLPQTSMCVPTFVNTVLSSTVTPTLQSQINEIQNQLMGVVTPTSTTTASAVPSTTASTANTSTVVTIATPTTPTSTTSSTTPPGGTGGGGSNKKKSSKKNSKKLEKAVKNLVGVVPGQIGNIQISQVDGTKAAPMSAKNVIDNQIQITPIMDTTKGQLQQMTSVAPQQQIIVSASQQVVGLPNIVTTASSGAATNVVHQPQILQHQIATAAPIQSVAAPNVVNLQPNIVQPNVQINLPNNLQPQIAPHPLMPQLTGALSLSLAEDGRLFLRHDANAPQDAQSQVILQTILSGALGNVTLITEPPNVEKQQSQQQQQVQAQQQQSTPVQNQPKIFTNNIIAPQKSLPTQQSIVTTHQGKSIVIPAAAAQASTAHFIPQTPTSSATTIASGSQQLSSALFSTAQGQILQQTSPVVTQNTIFSSQSSQQPQSVQLTTTASVIQQPEVQQGLKNVRKVQQATAQLQTSTATISPQSTAVLMNPNMPKFVELPKIGPNQQLFSLNTITNQITQINPGLTTASLGPMERLLIVPAGINAQQLAQCLLQGQIHFNNIGQVNQAQDRIESTQQSQMNSQKLPTVAGPQVSSNTLQITTTPATSVSNHQSAVQQQQMSQLPKDPPKVTAAAVKVNENKVKKATKVKKLKPVSEAKVIKMTQPTKNVVMMENRTLQKCNHFNDSSTKAQGRALVHPCTVSSAVATSNALSTSLGNVQLNTTVVCSTPTTSSVHVPNTAIVRPSIISNNARHQASSTNAHSHPIISPAINQAQPQQQPQVVQPMIPSPSPDHHTHHQQPLIQPKVHSQPANAANSKNHATGNTGGSLPPLVSVNTTLPRVQTIQLTPQKQQMLKDVQMKIQTLSGKLQNKTLLSTLTIPMDYDASSSVYNQPLPTLTNLHAMTDADIHAALQRLFLEQQKILATGKIIPTIPTSHSFPTMAPAAVPTTQLQVAVALPKQSATPGGGFLPSPIEITPPMAIKQEIHPSPVAAVTAAAASTASPTVLLTNAKILPGNSSHQLLAPNVNAESISAPQMSPKMKIPRQCLFERQLAVDQEGCTNPDAKTPFHSKEDAIKRLIRYHCTYGDGENEEEVQSEMEAFEKTANQFQDQFNGMINKYQLLLMKESTHHVQTSELMMIDRLLVSDIQKEILNIQMNISNDLSVSAKVQESSSEAGEIVPPSHVKSEVKCEVKKEDVIVESKSVSDVSSTAGVAAGDIIPPPTSAQNRPPSRATTAVAAAAAAASDVKHVSVVHYGTANSGSSGTNQLSAKNPSSDTKKEMEQFDIESEITPSFIMKKCESAPTKNQDLVEDGYQFGLDYYQQQQQQHQQDVPAKDTEPPDEDSKPEPYDEWLCIQKELGYISESNKRNEMKLSEISMGTSPNSSPLDHSKSVEKQLSEIFDHHSPKSVEHQLNDLFNPPSTSAKSNTESIVTSNSPLSEFFNTDSIVGNTGDKSVETRLEAMFGEAPEDDKADLVETRLEALFQGATQDSTTSYTAINPHTANNLHPGMLQSNMNKRQWNNGDILMSPASGNDSGESTCFPKRSFMGTAADNFVDSTTHMGNNNRWMSDYSNTPTMDHHPHSLDHQQPSSQQYDFMGDTMDCVLGETNQHHHTGEDGTTEINKRLWNGDLLAAHADVVPSKKMCFINKDMLDRDFMDMGGTPTQHQVSEMSMQHHHQMNHTGCGSMNTMTMGSGGGAGGAVVASQNNSISISMSTSSNFDEDISRQVQNAIDSILNLQSSEADSFHFSLDQMGSFLSDTALTPIIPTLQQQQQQPTTSQTSAVTRPPSVAKRKQLPATHFNHHTHQNQMQQHLEELSDCLMHGGSAESSGHHIIIDSSPSGSSSSSSTTAVSDFNSVTPSHDSAGLDDTVKSIITS